MFTVGGFAYGRYFYLIYKFITSTLLIAFIVTFTNLTMNTLYKTPFY